MQPDPADNSLLEAIGSCLEAITDPCSVASGAPAGLVSMGLVGPVSVEHHEDGAHVNVTLYITEPGCMMGALFQLTAQRELAKLPGISSSEVNMDYSHVWGPEQMAPDYRRRLAELRACRAARMNAQVTPGSGGRVG